jgi:hypothetical protein
MLALPLRRQSFDPVFLLPQGPVHWTAELDKDCLHATASDVHDDATCSSRSTKHCKQQHQQHFAVDQSSLDASTATCFDHVYLVSQEDAGVADQDVRNLQWQQLPNKERDPALRAAQQQEELMDMIR